MKFPEHSPDKKLYEAIKQQPSIETLEQLLVGLSSKQRNELLKEQLTEIKFHQFINTTDELLKVLQLLSVTEIRMFWRNFNSILHQQSQLIATPLEFINVMKNLSDNKKELFFNMVRDDRLPHFAKSIDEMSELDLCEIIECVPHDFDCFVHTYDIFYDQINNHPQKENINRKALKVFGEPSNNWLGKSAPSFVNILLKFPILIAFVPNKILSNIFTNQGIREDKLTALADHIGNNTMSKIIKKFSINEIRKSIRIFQTRPQYLSYISDEIKIRNIGHQLGLKGDLHERNLLGLANLTTKQRFKLLYKGNDRDESNPAEINMDDIGLRTLTSDRITKNLSEHGSLQGIHADWEKHAFSFHFIREGNKLHIIYVNRDKRIFSDDDQTVMVYSVDVSESENYISGLYRTLKTENRVTISAFIQDNLAEHLNIDATTAMKKSMQKVGNCTTANANISWHFKLVSNAMKKNHDLNLIDAYKQSKKEYKAMRLMDRGEAFCDLIKLRKSYPKESDFNQALYDVMKKMTIKDLVDPEREVVLFLLNALNQQSPQMLSELFDIITSENFLPTPTTSSMNYIRLHWANAINNQLPESDKQLNVIRLLEKNKTGKIDEFIHALEINDQKLQRIIVSHPSYINYIEPYKIGWILCSQNLDQTIRNTIVNHLEEETLEAFIGELDIIFAESTAYIFKLRPECVDYIKDDEVKDFITHYLRDIGDDVSDLRAISP